MMPTQFTKKLVLADLERAAAQAQRAVDDVQRDDRVDATDSIKLAQNKMQDALLRLTASLAADPTQRLWKEGA